VNYIKIEIATPSKLQEFDVSGKLIIEKQITGFENINVSELPNGIYLIKTENKTAKLVIAK
jgi:hypothetical protein